MLENFLICFKGAAVFFKTKREGGFFSRCHNGKGPHLALRRVLVVLKLRQQTWGSSRVMTGTQGPALWGLRKVQSQCELRGASQIPLQSLPGAMSSCGVEAGNSGFLSIPNMDLWNPLEFPQGSQASFRVPIECQIEVSFFSEVRRELDSFPNEEVKLTLLSG